MIVAATESITAATTHRNREVGVRRICLVCVLVVTSMAAAAWGAKLVTRSSRPAHAHLRLHASKLTAHRHHKVQRLHQRHTNATGARKAGTNVTSSTAVTTQGSSAFLFGDQAIEASGDSNPAGTAEAFAVNDQVNADATSISVYVDTPNVATLLLAGLYSNRSGHPGSLLATGSLAAPTAGALSASRQTRFDAATIAPRAPLELSLLERRWHPIGGGGSGYRQR